MSVQEIEIKCVRTENRMTTLPPIPSSCRQVSGFVRTAVVRGDTATAPRLCPRCARQVAAVPAFGRRVREISMARWSYWDGAMARWSSRSWDGSMVADRPRFCCRGNSACSGRRRGTLAGAMGGHTRTVEETAPGLRCHWTWAGRSRQEGR
jgi:hypothetical protein